MVNPNKPDVRDLLRVAKGIRDYCILTGHGGTNAAALIRSLAPFDDEAPTRQSDHLTKLRVALGDVCRDIDDHTLTRILAGDPPIWIRSPHPSSQADGASKDRTGFDAVMERLRAIWRPSWQRLLLPWFAITLLCLAIHYTQWTLNANRLLVHVDEHVSMDLQDEVRALIVLAQAVESNRGESGGPDVNMPAQTVFDEAMDEFAAYHFRETSLASESAAKHSEFHPIVAGRTLWRDIWDNLLEGEVRTGTQAEDDAADPPSDVLDATFEEKEATTPTDGGSEADALLEVVRDRDSPAMGAPIPGAPPSSGETERASSVALMQPALDGREVVLDVMAWIAEETGRDANLVGGHVYAQQSLVSAAGQLTDKIAIANRFALPIIYGSLGAALFCLVRVLTPALSDLGPGRASLRILFGAFAAMTMSMLFIPANVFTINDQSSPTLIFLVCFVFGYSFDAVLAALHRLEVFLQGQLTPRKPGG
ncbi:MAG: hypothetical protein AAF264_00370 [Pseudomonadota bacterium]